MAAFDLILFESVILFHPNHALDGLGPAGSAHLRLREYGGRVPVNP